MSVEEKDIRVTDEGLAGVDLAPSKRFHVAEVLVTEGVLVHQVHAALIVTPDALVPAPVTARHPAGRVHGNVEWSSLAFLSLLV